MAQKLDVNKMRVASPCRVGWDSMVGDDRARFCGSCARHVYNIVGLSRGEIESLVERTEGRLCVRMYQRADETVLTQDCPVGLRLVRKRVATFAGAALSALLGLVSVVTGRKLVIKSVRISQWIASRLIPVGREISGFVTDLSGAVVPGVGVSLKGVGFEKKTKTDTAGRFRFESVSPDLRYELSFAQEGFKKLVITDLDPASGEVLTVKVAMEAYTSQPYAPVIEQERSPINAEPTTSSSSLSTRPIDPCADSGPKVERMKIDSKRGAISGSITDVAGAVVPGIEVRLFQDKTLVALVTSDASGRFEIKNIKPAEHYVLKMADAPWKKQIIEEITVNAGKEISYGVCLQVGNVYEVVGLFGEPVEILLTDAAKPTETFVPRKTYPLPPTPKETSKPRPKR